MTPPAPVEPASAPTTARRQHLADAAFQVLCRAAALLVVALAVALVVVLIIKS